MEKSLVPNSEESEKCIICSIIHSREAYIDSKLIIKPEMFFDKFRREVWLRTCKIRDNIQGKIEWPMFLESCSGIISDKQELINTLNNIYSIVDTGDNWKYYAQILLDCYDLRRYIKVGLSIIDLSQDKSCNVDEVCDLRSNFFRSSLNHNVGVSAHDAVTKVLEEMEDEESIILPSPVESLKSIVPGFKPGQLILVGGRRGSGKTSLIRTLVTRMGIPAGIGSLVFSFEAPYVDMAAGMAAILGRVCISDIAFRRLSANQIKDLSKALAVLAKSDVQIIDQNQDVFSICARIEQWMTERRVGLVYVDYAQLVMETGKRNRSVENEVSNVGRMLKIQAMHQPRCCIFLLTQLNSEGESKYAKALADHCDVFLKIRDGENGNKMIEVDKQRLGEVGEVEVNFWKETGEFY